MSLSKQVSHWPDLSPDVKIFEPVYREYIRNRKKKYPEILDLL